MRLYENNLACAVDQIDKKLQNLRTIIPFGDKIIIKRLFALFMIIYIEPIKKQTEFNRGTVHYICPIMLSVGITKASKGKVCMHGIAFFDVISKILFSGPVFVGVALSFHSFVAGLVSSLIVYIVVAFISWEENCKTWQRFKSFLNQ